MEVVLDELNGVDAAIVLDEPNDVDMGVVMDERSGAIVPFYRDLRNCAVAPVEHDLQLQTYQGSPFGTHRGAAATFRPDHPGAGTSACVLWRVCAHAVSIVFVGSSFGVSGGG